MPRRFDDDLDDEKEPRPEPLVRLLSDLGGAVRRAGAAPAPRGRAVQDEGGEDDASGARRGRDRFARRGEDEDSPPSRPKPVPFGGGMGRAGAGRASGFGEGGAARPRGAPAAGKPGSPSKTPYGGGKRKAPRAPNAERFWASVLYAVAQRETCSGGLRQILSNKVRRYALTLEGEARAEAEASGALLVEAAVERAVRERLIDDARYAEMKARGWRARGWGERRIAMELKRKGLGTEQSQDALAAVDAENLYGIEDVDRLGQEADAEAAERLCRKRRIGPYRQGPMPDTHADRARVWRREAGILARAGFSGSLVSEILGRPPAEPDEG